MADTPLSIVSCGLEDCSRPVLRSGLCSAHYQRKLRHGRLHLVVHPLPEKCEAPGCGAKPRNRVAGKALCNLHGLRLARHGTFDLIARDKKKELKNCVVDQCDNRVRSGGADYCEVHYYRLRRTGKLGPRVPAPPRLNSQGYIYRNCKGHPLAASGGHLLEHREVLFDHIGVGPHSCFWCGDEIDWRASGRRKLVVDHLDGNKANNEPSNLKPSCHSCNSNRGLFQNWVMKHRDDPFLWALYVEHRNRAA